MPLFLQVRVYLVCEKIRVARRYYKHLPFACVDLVLSLLYLFSNPFRICRKFLQKRGAENIHTYGETPLTTLETIVSSFGIQPSDRWLELGSGRGQGSFWISLFWGCQVRGVEWVPTFVKRANWIKKIFKLKRIEFQNTSMLETDFSWARVVYLCGTCMSDEEIEALLVPMQALPKGAKVITITEPLSHPSYQLVESIPVSFPWGETDAYLQIKA